MENQPINQTQSSNSLSDKRSLIPALFATAIICFFFNFFTVSCGGEKVKEVKGIDLVIGSDSKDQPDTTAKSFFSEQPSQDEKIPSNVWAIIAFGAAILGMGIYMIKEKNESLIGTAAGVTGAGSLLILQYIIKNEIEKKAEGAPITVEFELAYWAAVISLGLAAYISYQRLQKGKNVTTNATSQASNMPTASPQQVVDPENLSTERETFSSPENPILQVQTETVREQPQNGFDTSEWIQRNKLVVAGLLIACITGYGVYFFVLRNDPTSDGKKVAVAECDCEDEYQRAQINALQNFTQKFDTYKFKSRQVAKATLDSLKNPSCRNYNICLEKTDSIRTKLNEKYAIDKMQKEKFDYAFNAQKELCKHDIQESLIQELHKLANGKISTINDPLPGIEKIKADLIGQVILRRWRFAYLDEFKSAEIIDVVEGANRVEYQIKFDLIDIAATQSEYECEVIVVYLKNAQGWHFNYVRPIYFR